MVVRESTLLIAHAILCRPRLPGKEDWELPEILCHVFICHDKARRAAHLNHRAASHLDVR